MRKSLILLASALLVASSAFAAEPGKAQFNWYGFIRNYITYDSHESSAGTEELYYYMPKDNDNPGTTNFVAITSRLGLDVKGYEVEGYKVAAKIETDFYSKNGTTAVLRLRQAYVTLDKDSRSWKIGQAWHPMAADLPDIFSLESGVPFGPFSRTPQINLEYSPAKNLSFTAAALWQMQYVNVGPEGSTANYIKRSGLPELYVGLNYKSGKNIFRLGADVLNISPVTNTMLTTVNVFEYGQLNAGYWTIKEKVVYANDGSHLNMVGGYGATVWNITDGFREFTATRNLSGWLTATFKKSPKWVPSILLGYIRNFGTPEAVISSDAFVGETFWAKNSADKVASMFRIQPEIVYNLGKIQFGAEYMLTGVEYGKPDEYKRVKEDLHKVLNHRVQFMVKYTF